MMKSIGTMSLLLLGTILMLGGCERPDVDIQACDEDCVLGIVLPDDPSQPPGVLPDNLHVVGGSEVEINVRGGPQGQERTVLRFELPNTPFLGPGGRPMETVPLQAGNKVFRIRPYADQVCHPPEGCKYDIVNVGNEDRPERDPWITIHPN